jgi:hypothetical protein
MKKFKVTTFQYEPTEDEKFIDRKYALVKGDLDWQEAKKIYKENRGSFIVRVS